MEEMTALFSARQWKILRAAMDRIVPGDEFPSASQADVGRYFERQYRGDLAGMLPALLEGLDSLDREALLWGEGFPEQSAQARDTILRRVEFGEVSTAWTSRPAGFFEHLVRLTMEGFYANPGNGGNRDEASWRMIGFEVTG